MTVVSADNSMARQADVPVTDVIPIDYDNPQHDKFTPTFRRLVLPVNRETRLTRTFTSLLAIGIAGLYLFALLCYWAPAHPGVDQNGYFVGGREFAETLSTGLTLRTDYDFVGRMYIRAESGENFPKYPLGLPILFALCIWLQPLWNLVGWDGHDVAHLISPVSAALATLGLFYFVRRLAGSYLGLLSMLVLGLSQVMLTLSINPNSHALGTCLTVWSFYLMIRWLETGSLWRGMLCAFLLGYAYLVRYTEGLQIIPLGVAMLFAAVWMKPSLRRYAFTLGGTLLFAVLAYFAARFFGANIAAGSSWLKPLTEEGGRAYVFLAAALVAAALVSLFIQPRSLWRLLVIGFAWLVPVLYQTIFNMVEMGSFTSYAGTNESTGFHRDYFFANWEKMVRVLNDQGLFFVAPIGLVGLIAMYRKLPLMATILMLWFLPSVLLYTAYYWAPDQWGVAYSRFILTELPALVIPAAWLLSKLIVDPAPALSLPSRPHRTALAGVALLAAGVFGAVWFSRGRSPLEDSTWWSTVVISMLLAIAGAAIVAGSLSIGRQFFARQLANPVPRLAIGVAAFIACGVAGFRSVNGTEWGQRIIPRANLESQSIENKNLAQLGKAARAAITDDDAIVFAEGDRLHHLQWLRRWQMFSADAFNPETVRRLFGRNTADENEPDPIDPGRLNFLRDVYAGKNQAELVAEQNRVMAEAIAAGRRVFLVLNESSAKSFVAKFVTSSKRRDGVVFESSVRDTVTDIPLPRSPGDFLEPNERPKMPVGRNGRALAFPLAGRNPTTWQIIEITAKTPEPSTPPTTRPATVAEAE